MGSGGARARSGPAPDPDALRRDREKNRAGNEVKAADGWIRLPASGRPGRAPAWPLTTASKRETELWRRHWKKPQAVQWEKLGQELEVALYIRRLVEAETRDSPVNLSTLVRQMSDSLGLTTPGLRSNRWLIVVDEVSERRESRTAGKKATASSSSTRKRLRVVDKDVEGA